MKSILLIVLVLVLSSAVFAGELRSVSSTEFLWVDNGQPAATVSKTSIENWKVKRIDGFYIGIITKRGNITLREGRLPVDDVNMITNIQKALLPYLGK